MALVVFAAFVVLQGAMVVGIVVNWQRSRGPDVLPNAKAAPTDTVVRFDPKLGYFQGERAPDEMKQTELNFQVQDVNDLLKSLTRQDLKNIDCAKW